MVMVDLGLRTSSDFNPGLIDALELQGVPFMAIQLGRAPHLGIPMNQPLVSGVQDQP